MESLFKLAEKLAVKPTITRSVSKGSVGVVIRRSGKVIKDGVKRSLPSVPVIKKKEKVDRSALDNTTVSDFEDAGTRRKALGKYVYGEREQLLQVLTQGYSVKLESVEGYSFTKLLSIFDDCKMEEAKRVEMLKKVEVDKEERLGAFYNSFHIVSDVTSVCNTEHYKLEDIEPEDEDIIEDGLCLSEEAKEAAEIRWAARKVVLQAKQEEERYLKYACKDFSMDEIKAIESGTVERVVDPYIIKQAKKRQERLDFFLSKGINHVEAEIKVKQWEASL